MKHDLLELYHSKFFGARDRYNWRASLVCGTINWMWRKQRDGGPIKSVIDIGAAVGDLVDCFLWMKKDAWGVEGSEACVPYLVCPRERMAILDLRERFLVDGKWPVAGWPERFDLVTCWEVAEHIEPEYVDVFLANLTDLSDKILMSACPPCPEGRPSKGSVGHFNEQPYEYWEEKFNQLGYRRIEKKEEVFRVCLYAWRGKYGIKAFWENCLYFELRP